MPYWGQKSKNWKFELGEHLNLHFTVKFQSESNGDSFDALTRYLDPKMAMRAIKVKFGTKNRMI